MHHAFAENPAERGRTRSRGRDLTGPGPRVTSSLYAGASRVSIPQGNRPVRLTAGVRLPHFKVGVLGHGSGQPEGQTDIGRCPDDGKIPVENHGQSHRALARAGIFVPYDTSRPELPRRCRERPIESKGNYMPAYPKFPNRRAPNTMRSSSRATMPRKAWPASSCTDQPKKGLELREAQTGRDEVTSVAKGF